MFHLALSYSIQHLILCISRFSVFYIRKLRYIHTVPVIMPGSVWSDWYVCHFYCYISLSLGGSNNKLCQQWWKYKCIWRLYSILSNQFMIILIKQVKCMAHLYILCIYSLWMLALKDLKCWLSSLLLQLSLLGQELQWLDHQLCVKIMYYKGTELKEMCTAQET